VDKIKIGFIGADYFSQATAYLLTEAVAHIDRTRFVVIAYDYGLAPEDHLRTRAFAAYDEVVSIHDLSDTAAAERIHGDGIEVLFSIKNLTNARLGILARRPAPLQVHFLYFPGTSGMPFFDAFVADEIVVPPALEYGYSEKIWRIDGCYQPNDDTRPLPRESNKVDWSLPPDAIVLANMSQGYKITPNIFDLWMRILRNNPSCILWLLADNNAAVSQRLGNEAAQRGVNPNRLYFSPRMSTQDHLTRLLCADLIIDTFPYGGHTLTSDALWAGTPVVTLAGETYASRVAASLLTHVGMPELVTYSHDAYVRGIQALIEDAPRRTAYRAHLTQNRRNFELFSSSSYAQRFETMVRRYARGV
jgi:predicted O-linked N-acetylglucosamine transferase (SPINDLY family)